MGALFLWVRGGHFGVTEHSQRTRARVTFIGAIYWLVHQDNSP
jgi:hypothetical protein